MSNDESTRLSVAVASFRDPELLAATLESLGRALGGVPFDAEVYVARPTPCEDVESLFFGRDWAHLVPYTGKFSGVADLPKLRGAALHAAGDGWVAVTEDHCVADAGWLHVFAESRARSHQVVGGGMGNAKPGAVNWAAYFSEYGFFSSARPPGEGFSLVTGANVMYGPEVTSDVATWATGGAWEDVIHQRLAAGANRFRFVPSARVSQNTTYELGAFCKDRFGHGYGYARDRCAEHPEMSRVMRIATTPLLPFVLFARVAKAAARENVAAFVVASPVTFTFLAAWAVGEVVGYCKGARGPKPSAAAPDQGRS